MDIGRGLCYDGGMMGEVDDRRTELAAILQLPDDVRKWLQRQPLTNISTAQSAAGSLQNDQMQNDQTQADKFQACEHRR